MEVEQGPSQDAYGRSSSKAATILSFHQVSYANRPSDLPLIIFDPQRSQDCTTP